VEAISIRTRIGVVLHVEQVHRREVQGEAKVQERELLLDLEELLVVKQHSSNYIHNFFDAVNNIFFRVIIILIVFFFIFLLSMLHKKLSVIRVRVLIKSLNCAHFKCANSCARLIIHSFVHIQCI